MKKMFVLLSVMAFGLSQAQKPLPVYLEDQKLAESTLTVGGKTYVPLSLLNRLGYNYELNLSGLFLKKNVVDKTAKPIPTTPVPGGSNQRASVEGCIGEQLFNGVWRFKVNKVEALREEDFKSRLYGYEAVAGWRVYLQLTNGTNRSLFANNGGIETSIAGTYMPGLNLAFSDSALGTSDRDNTSSMEETLKGTKIPQGASNSFQIIFYWGNKGDNPEGIKPTKLLFEMRPDLLAKSAKEKPDAKGLQFSTSSPSFRVDLTCQK